MKSNNIHIIDILIAAGRDSNADYVGCEETKFIITHTFATSSRASCAKTVNLFSDIVSSRRAQGVAVFVQNTDVIITQIKK